jgi:hypothetical protein
MKRMAIFWFVESLFGSRQKRTDWSLTLTLVGIALTFWLLLVVR